MAITKEQIILASIAVLNRGGIERLTTRELAGELNIKSASLYWHFKDKRELYGEIAEYMVRGMELPEKTDNARQFLTEAMRSFRRLLLTVRDSPAIFENSPPNTPERIEVIKKISRKLFELGVKYENLPTVSNMLNNYVLSFAADEARFKSAPPGAFNVINKEVFPETPLLLRDQTDFDGQFLYGLRILFSGIENA